MKRMRKLFGLAVCLIISFSFTITAMAKTDMTFDEAKEYLKTYSITQKNSFGKEYTTEFVFQSNEDLEGIAQYISVNGLDQFHKVVDEEIAKKIRAEASNRDIAIRSTNPSTGYAYVSGNGTHSVKNQRMD